MCTYLKMKPYSMNNMKEEYIKAALQWGHSIKELNPKMIPYLVGSRENHYVFDLVKTEKLLAQIRCILEKKAYEKGKFLFVGTDALVSSSVLKYATSCNSFYINYKWLGGLLTNWSTTKKQINLLNKLEVENQTQMWLFLSKKDTAEKQKQRIKLKKLLGGVQNMTSVPEMVIFTNQFTDSIAIKECLQQGISAISIVDSNGDPLDPTKDPKSMEYTKN